MTIGYELLPHTTDAYIQVTGESLEQALARAGAALFDTMCDVKSVSPELTDEIELQGGDELMLLYNWLESLLLKFELDEKVYSRFKVEPIKKSTEGLRSVAKISGERYDRRKHGSKIEVKAVTYHKMEVVREDSTTILRFILDL